MHRTDPDYPDTSRSLFLVTAVNPCSETGAIDESILNRFVNLSCEAFGRDFSVPVF
jgi:hypothetical protein